MKVEWNKKYNTIAAYSIMVITFSILFFIALSNIKSFGETIRNLFLIAQPFIIGGVLAYLLNFIMVFLEDKIEQFNTVKNLNFKKKRVISLCFTYMLFLMLCIIFIKIICPQLVESLVGLANTVPQYVSESTAKLSEIFSKIDIPDTYSNMLIEKWNEMLTFVINVITNATPAIANWFVTLTSSVLNIIIGLVVSVYALLDKEKFIAISKKVLYAFLNNDRVETILYWARKSNNIFGKFIGGKIVDSVIIGILTCIIMLIFKMPYAVLVSVIVGITNIIPVFGPFIGAIPCFIIILVVSPTHALWFLLLILIIQQIDGNIIGPYILGDSVGVSAFWILFAVLIFSKFMGVAGMVVGVPIFAIIYQFIKEVVEGKLSKKGMPIETEHYLNDCVKKK